MQSRYKYPTLFLLGQILEIHKKNDQCHSSHFFCFGKHSYFYKKYAHMWQVYYFLMNQYLVAFSLLISNMVHINRYPQKYQEHFGVVNNF